jgi:predicted CoA-binding protein
MGYINHAEPYSDDYLKDILSSVKTIAMVGASAGQDQIQLWRAARAQRDRL